MVVFQNDNEKEIIDAQSVLVQQLIIAADNHDHSTAFAKIIGITIKALIMQPSYYQINIQQDCTVPCSAT